jgi:hypothetical protein
MKCLYLSLDLGLYSAGHGIFTYNMVETNVYWGSLGYTRKNLATFQQDVFATTL